MASGKFCTLKINTPRDLPEKQLECIGKAVTMLYLG